MTDHARIASAKIADSLKAAAFDLSPEPALVVDREGALVAVNEAAEALFGQGLSLLARGRFRAALPPGSVLVSMMDRALFEGALVREHGVEVNLFGQPPFEADGAAAPLGDGSVMLTLHVKGVLGVERASRRGGPALGGGPGPHAGPRDQEPAGRHPRRGPAAEDRAPAPPTSPWPS